MSKNIWQDVIPPKRSIRDIQLPKMSEHRERRADNHDTPIPEIIKHPKRKLGGMFWSVLFFSVVIFGIIFYSAPFFTNAIVTVTPKQGSFTLNTDMIASTDNSSALKYHTLKSSAIESTLVKADEKKMVSERAMGEVMVYNGYSTQNQRLITNTRFEGTNGLIYRIVESVSVPGSKIVSGKSVPGSIKAILRADEPGLAHNTKNMDFSIPAFKGTPKHKTIYARSTNKIDGGLIGEVRVVNAKLRDETIAILKAKSLLSLGDIISKKTPPDMISFSGTDKISYEILMDEQQTSGVKVSIEATTYSVLFNRDVLTTQISNILNPDAKDQSMRILNLEDVVITPSDDSLISIGEGKPLKLNITGRPYMVWNFSKEKLLASILGKSKGSIPDILINHPEIAKIDIVSKPFWKNFLPKSSEKIKILEKISYKNS